MDKDLALQLLTHMSDPEFLTDKWNHSDTAKSLGVTAECVKNYTNVVYDMLSKYPHKFRTFDDALVAYKAQGLYDAHTCLYNRYKQVYEPNEAFYTELMNTEQPRIYLTDLGHLPFHSFKFDVSKIDFPTISDPNTGQAKRLDSIYVSPVWYNYNAEYAGTKLNAPKRYTMCIYILYVFEREGEKHPMLPDVIYLFDSDLKDIKDLSRLDDDHIGIGENENPYWDYIPENHRSILFQRNVTLSDAPIMSITSDNVEKIHRFIFQMLLYLSSDSADITETKYSIKQKSRAKRLKDNSLPTTTSIVGSRYGQVMESYHKNKRFYDKIRTISSSNKRPHMVRAHWHHYWKGSGDERELILKWTHAYFTGNGNVDTVIHSSEMGKEKGSKGERLVRGILQSLGIDFIEQFYVPEIGKLYDFALLVDDELKLIEFDGQQHFEPVANWDFEKTKQSDKEKDDYARSHDIPLLRIKYDEITDVTDIVTRFVKGG